MKINKFNRVDIKNLLKKLEGIHSINSIASIMHCSKKKAIYYVYRLRKYGYVKTRKNSKNKRIYNISFENKLGGKSYIEIINQYSPIKVSSSEDYKIYGKTPSLEETLVFAINSKNFRLILASLALFKKIHNWIELYKLAKTNKIEREIGALYDVTREFMRVRKMKKRFRKNILPRKNEKYKFIVDKIRSNDFKNIEKLWKVYIPFNIKDLEEYKK